MPDAWRGFKPGLWQRDVNVRWFIQRNYTPYEGDGAFLVPATERTRRLWKRLEELFVGESPGSSHTSSGRRRRSTPRCPRPTSFATAKS